jgi:hypothetical protein
MTPFDPVALVAMLVAFYSPPSVPRLQQARAARPEYFAAGRLGGTSGEKLFLADGRIFDLIFAVDGPVAQRRYQALDVTDATGDPDPFPLEPGPLDLLDEEAPLFPASRSTEFTALVAEELDAFGASDQQLTLAGVAVAEFAGADDLEAASVELLGPADEHHAAMREALDLDDPAEELEAAGLTRHTIDAAVSEYDTEEAPDIAEDDPGDPPREKDDDGEGKGKGGGG